MEVLNINNVSHQINEEITDNEVRMIDEDGAQLGIMPISEAMQIAIQKDLDLVKIAPTSNPPVCKVMDYGKYRYEQAKKVKEVRRHQHVVEVKEIRMSPSIGENDFKVKLRNGLKFLKEGDRLKITVRFRGREMAHTDLGEKLLTRFAEECTEFGTVDKNPKLDGRHMSMFLTPKQSRN
ncbi:MAG: translation initiation factor IF-3 [Oscillospiraceae bacterium]|nr:translation initiation factor IF-3 [Oscillospiraceae bacterium]MCL2278554.1 translation initiation factor IF-3 [Oscillospiraceae bacterium]